ncbi:MAG: aromatic-ring-hydroxylating dioxygenase subunit beta [Proteobacteria bacterium]|nr:aromatic-ring-hydroxylating dioxygenase subunit beta [Pseudomonadota bacterium]
MGETKSALVSESQARRLIVDYACAIDALELSKWPAFFTDPCLYRITTRQNEEQNMPLSIMLCDNRAMLYDRVEAIEKANVFEPHYYRHILSDSRTVGDSPDGIRAETSFMCVRTMLDGRMTLFAAGVFHDEIVSENGACRFRSRTVVLDASQVDTLIAIPL